MRYILLLTTCILAGITLAQPARYRSPNGISDKKNYDRRALQPYFLSLRGGLTQFYGELNAQAMHGIAGIGIGKSLNKQFAVQLDYNAGRIGGEKREFFNSWFVNEYNSLECLVKWDLSEQFGNKEPGPVHFNVYAGLGQIWFSANAFDLDDNRLLRFTNSTQSARNPFFLRWGPPKGPKGIRKTREGILPLGTSVDYALLEKLKIALEYRFYFVRTDKLDATSGHRLINPEESESYSDTPNDAFSFIAVSMQYYFGKKEKRMPANIVK
ncbi:hypothetical protein SAMN04487996_1187 [Dyadobacter soli]|uniref:Outer membrane protein beta-barrel domain-containing protein n=1 Tax=Dyadobacter soli TaxID=659014 RepID=A0A1G7TNN1_9BACT|nr:hypothetical protein [Dyadobacter soli]SDG36885.1 hypothetical protein SAMN04487996_1187 [Dyadobacter soli]